MLFESRAYHEVARTISAIYHAATCRLGRSGLHHYDRLIVHLKETAGPDSLHR